MIDVKELRIGAHYYNTSYTKPVIGRIMSIYDKDRVTLCYDMPLDPETDPYEGAMLHDLEPIPLTAELLQEIGFVKLFSNIYSNEFGGEYFSQTIEVSNPIGVCSSVYGVSYRDDDNHNYDVGCRYLHELEAFVYLTTKQELIKED